MSPAPCQRLVALLAPAAVIAGSAVVIGADPGQRGDALARFIAFGSGYALYFAVFVFITLGVSASASSRRLSDAGARSSGLVTVTGGRAAVTRSRSSR